MKSESKLGGVVNENAGGSTGIDSVAIGVLLLRVQQNIATVLVCLIDPTSSVSTRKTLLSQLVREFSWVVDVIGKNMEPSDPALDSGAIDEE